MKNKILNIINSNKLSACVHVVVKKDDSFEVKKLEVEERTVDNIQDTIVATLQLVFTQRDAKYLSLTQIASEHNNAIYTLDNYREISGLNFIDFVAQNKIATYQTEHGDFAAFIIEVSNGNESLYCYQNITPASLIKQNARIPLVRHNNTFSQSASNVFVVESRVDFVILENALCVKNWKLLQSKFSFDNFIAKESKKTLSKIKELKLLSDTTALEQEAARLSVSKQLMKASNSNVFKFPKEIILSNARNAARYKKLFNNSGSLVVDTKEKVKLFIKLLNDDILISPITKLEYDVTFKKEMGDQAA